MERYMEAAQQILGRVIITPSLHTNFASAVMEPAAPSKSPGRPLAPAEELSATVAIYMDGEYNLRVSIERPRDTAVQVIVKVDGKSAGTLNYERDPNGSPTNRAQPARLGRGVHTISIVGGKLPVEFYSLTVEQIVKDPPPEKRVLHFALFGREAGEAPPEPRKAAERLIAKFLRKAFRRPVEPAEVARFMAMYNRAAERGDPYEERVKLALKAALVSPAFLFRIEERKDAPGI